MSEYAADVTLVEVLDDLRRRGFAGEFLVDDDGSARCAACGHRQAKGDVDLAGLRRVEGASDPGDMAAVLAITCPNCGRHGTAVLRFGPEAGLGDSALLAAHAERPANPRPAAAPRQLDPPE